MSGSRAEPLSVTPIIHLAMLTAAALMPIFAHINAAALAGTGIVAVFT